MPMVAPVFVPVPIVVVPVAVVPVVVLLPIAPGNAPVLAVPLVPDDCAKATTLARANAPLRSIFRMIS